MEFSNAVREGDGFRILRCWRYLMLIFKATNRTNYSGEAFTLLVQYHFLFSKRVAMQLIWSRTINVHGRPGKNVSCDLHCEHLNRECKNSISGLGANVTDNAVQRVGKCLGETVKVMQHFNEINNISLQSGSHTRRSATQDLSKLVKQFQESKVFHKSSGRRHHNFPKFTANKIKHLSMRKLKLWMNEHLQKLLIYLSLIFFFVKSCK